MIALEIYGKKDCKACEGAKKKFKTFVKKWNLKDSIIFKFFDVDTEKGAEARAFNGITKIPTIVLVDIDRNKELNRWEGKVPLSKDFENILKENL